MVQSLWALMLECEYEYEYEYEYAYEYEITHLAGGRGVLDLLGVELGVGRVLLANDLGVRVRVRVRVWDYA